jgi:hypothetical protein
MTPLPSDGLHYAVRQGRSPWAGWSVVAASRSRGKLPSGAIREESRIWTSTPTNREEPPSKGSRKSCLKQRKDFKLGFCKEWGFRSRQSEATMHAVLYTLPDELIPFVRESVRVLPGLRARCSTCP